MNSQALLQLTAFSDDPWMRRQWMELANDFDNSMERLYKTATIMELIKSTRLYKYSGVTTKINPWCSGWYVWVDVQHAPVDYVIENYCSVLHQNLGIKWDMEVGKDLFEIKGKYDGIEVKFDIYEDLDIEGCRIVERKVPVKREEYTMTHYDILCDE